jgi:hypothetical protein
MLSSNDRGHLEHQSWVALDIGTSDESLLALADDLGTPVPSRAGRDIISFLKPREANPTSRPTFSSTFGLGVFPLHTDSAHWPLPCRYVILRDVGESHDRPTIVAAYDDFVSTFDREALNRAVWRVAGPRGSFVCNSIAQLRGRRILRFDPLCMRPLNQSAVEVISTLKLKNVASTCLQWRKGITLIIDNWNAVHGRANRSSNDDGSRVLQRVLVFDSKLLPLFPYVLAT